MEFVALLSAALKAFPEFIQAIRDLSSAITTLQNSVTEKNIDKIKGEVSTTLGKIANAKDNKERAALIAALNKSLKL